MLEPKPDPQLEALKGQLSELITINKALLKKLEEQGTMLGSIGRFVRENSGSATAFGVVRR